MTTVWALISDHICFFALKNMNRFTHRFCTIFSDASAPQFFEGISDVIRVQTGNRSLIDLPSYHPDNLPYAYIIVTSSLPGVKVINGHLSLPACDPDHGATPSDQQRCHEVKVRLTDTCSAYTERNFTIIYEDPPTPSHHYYANSAQWAVPVTVVLGILTIVLGTALIATIIHR